MHELKREQWVPAPLDEVFEFFSNAGNLEALTPPWLRFEIVTPLPVEMRPGARIAYRIRRHFLALRWESEIVEWTPPLRFVDVQLRGPYREWRHTHEFASADGGTWIRDRVRYALPLGPLGALVQRFAVRRDLERVFDFRSQRINELFGAQSSPSMTKRADQQPPPPWLPVGPHCR